MLELKQEEFARIQKVLKDYIQVASARMEELEDAQEKVDYSTVEWAQCQKQLEGLCRARGEASVCWSFLKAISDASDIDVASAAIVDAFHKLEAKELDAN